MEKTNFDPVVYWMGLGLPIEMLKIVPGSGGKDAVCEYCGYKLELFGGYLERHTDTARHKMNVNTYKINTESKIQADKKRQRSPSPTRKGTSPSPPPVVVVEEEPKKKKPTLSDIIRTECAEQLIKVRDECVTRLKTAHLQYITEYEAELKKIDWKALIAEEARNHVRNMVKDMFEKEATE